MYIHAIDHALYHETISKFSGFVNIQSHIPYIYTGLEGPLGDRAICINFYLESGNQSFLAKYQC